MWEACNHFVNEIKIDFLTNKLMQKSVGGYILDKSYLENNRKEVIKEVQNFRLKLNNYSKVFYSYYNNLIELRDLASKNLNIKERELSHHILKYSPIIMHKKLDSLLLIADSMSYLVKLDNNDGNHLDILSDNAKEIIRIHYDIKNNVLKSLSQVLLYNYTHKYLIGLASTSSTSKSLEIFLGGISSIVNGASNLKEKNKTDIIFHIQIENELLTLLHRSKAHYGMDLLITLENLYKSYSGDFNEREKEIIEVLYHLKYKNGITGIGPSAKFSKQTFIQVALDYKKELTELKESYLKIHKKDLANITANFTSELSLLKKKRGRKILCIFGYSQVLIEVLKVNSDVLSSDEFLVFIFKENRGHMVDTRMFRFELNDDKPLRSIRNTFTASDEFLLSLIDKKDNVVFLCGAEAYCASKTLLWHTNIYHNRVDNILQKLYDKVRDFEFLSPEIWIISNKYKQFDSFPPPYGFFKNEMFSDHYDEVDLYNFSNVECELKLL